MKQYNEKPDITFNCPQEMQYWSQKVFDGEYEVNFSRNYPMTILDIGANCGAFALWADLRWPGSTIYCYEPAAVSHHYLTLNTSRYPNILTTKAAVLTTDKAKLYVGKLNQGEASFCPDLGQTNDTYELPPIIHPRDLPKSDILKCDTEGCELEIILGLNNAGLLPDCILLEYHRESDRRAIDIELRKYDLVGSHADVPGRGVVKYVRRT